MPNLEPAVVAELVEIPSDTELQAELQRRWDAFVADPSRAIPGDVFLQRLRNRKNCRLNESS